MFTRNAPFALAASLFACLTVSQAFAQESEQTYTVPRTEYGQPNLQGVWTTRFYTMLERPPGLPLVLPPEAAGGFAQAVYEGAPDNVDPDIDNFGAPVLTQVKGEYRTSVIVYPENGRMPFNELGEELANHEYFKGHIGMEHPEQRPGVERCIESWGAPPIRAFFYQLFHAIVQTEDQVAIISEDGSQTRVIHMDEWQKPDVIRTLDGHSVGRWEGDTLVVTTTHFRHDLPERANIDRPMLISGDATVTERFTRVAEDELNYQYTVDDPTYYTEPWRGEFSLTLDPNGHIYEYSCHEGNYSMVGALRGERVLEVREELGIQD